MKNVTFLLLLLTGFLPVQAQDTGNDSIPVRLNSLDAGRVNNSNLLNWKVTCLLDYAYFEVQRSADGIAYSTIHTFQADKARCREPFSFTDQHSNEKSFYRVRVGDTDGKFYTSKIVAVFGKVNGFDIVCPGIVTHNSLPLTIASETAGKIQLRIISLQGYNSFHQQVAVAKGKTSLLLSIPTLSRGAYVLTVTNISGKKITTRFMKQ